MRLTDYEIETYSIDELTALARQHREAQKARNQTFACALANVGNMFRLHKKGQPFDASDFLAKPRRDFKPTPAAQKLYLILLTGAQPKQGDN